MEVFATCMECLKELGHPSFEHFNASYFEDRVAYITCDRGHTSAHVLKSQRFEVLLESGANALEAGFTLEASASFAAALERLYEFGIRVMFAHRKADASKFEKMFKIMSRQSERQLGAFLALYLLEFEDNYTPQKDITEFRNGVIHKGTIPTPDAARNFCSLVYAEIVLITDNLRSKMGDAIGETISLDLKERVSKIKPAVPHATTTGTMFFNLANAENRKKTFAEAYEYFQNAKMVMKNSVPYMRIMHQLVSVITGGNQGKGPPA